MLRCVVKLAPRTDPPRSDPYSVKCADSLSVVLEIVALLLQLDESSLEVISMDTLIALIQRTLVVSFSSFAFASTQLDYFLKCRTSRAGTLLALRWSS